MSKKSWGVTLTPLFLAVMQIAELKLTGRAITNADIALLFAEISAFIGSGAIGAIVSLRKK